MYCSCEDFVSQLNLIIPKCADGHRDQGKTKHWILQKGYNPNMKNFCLLLIMSASLCTGCTVSQPSNINNLCSIFQEKSSWYDDARDANEKWGTPIHVMMAIMRQESGFVADAKPPMEYFLFIPIGRPSSAYGYPQAQDPVWKEYKEQAGGWFASRDNFADAIDFIGWYTYQSQKRNGTSKWDAYNQYLNYHEGWGGFKRNSHRNKPWLLKVAQKVANRASVYSVQLKQCDL